MALAEKKAVGSLRDEYLKTLDPSTLPGFDPMMHRSPVVDEFVEDVKGVPTVIYRTKREISEEAERRYPILVFPPRYFPYIKP